MWCSSKSSTKIFSHVFAIKHIWNYNFFKYLYILATSLRTHYGIMPFKKINGFLIYKYIVNVDGPLLCSHNGGNSPQKNDYIINIYF